MGKSYMEPFYHREENSTIVVRMTNSDGELFASIGLPWAINYHSEDIEGDVARHSAIIVQLAFAAMERRFNNPQSYLSNEWENPENKYEIIILKAAWGTVINSGFTNVEVGIA